MPTPTYTPLANTTTTSGVASVTFSSMTAGFRDYVLVCNFGSVSGSTSGAIKINSDTGSNYNYVVMSGDGSTAISDNGSGETLAYLPQFNMTAGTPADAVINFMDATATDKHKTLLIRTGSERTTGNRATTATAYRWASTSAITSINVYMRSGAFTTGSTFALYGIAS